jgi:hypothetical protein
VKLTATTASKRGDARTGQRTGDSASHPTLGFRVLVCLFVAAVVVVAPAGGVAVLENLSKRKAKAPVRELTGVLEKYAALVGPANLGAVTHSGATSTRKSRAR